MKLMFLMSIPALIVAIVVLFTTLASWTYGHGLCGTWMAPIWPYCHYH